MKVNISIYFLRAPTVFCTLVPKNIKKMNIRQFCKGLKWWKSENGQLYIVQRLDGHLHANLHCAQLVCDVSYQADWQIIVTNLQFDLVCLFVCVCVCVLHLFTVFTAFFWGAVVAERLEPRTSIPEVPGSSPSPVVAPLGKALYPHCLVFRRRL